MRGIMPAANWYRLTNLSDSTVEIDIRGMIGAPLELNDWGFDAAGTFRELENQLRAAGDVDEIRLNIFSAGGYVWDALAFHDVLVRHPAKVTAYVDGLAASAATTILMAADEIRIPSNAQVMIHNTSIMMEGDHRALNSMVKKMRGWDTAVANQYVSRMMTTGNRTDAGAALNEVLTMMDEETWLTGTEAVALGLADQVTDEVALTACVKNYRHESPRNRVDLDKVPDPFRSLFDKSEVTNTTATEPTSPMSTPAAPSADPAPVAEPTNDVEVAPAAPVEETPVAEVEEVTPEAAPVEAAAPEAPAPVADPAPENDIASIITGAVAAAVEPLRNQIEAQAGQIENLQNLRNADVPVNAWPNSAPTDSPVNSADGSDEPVEVTAENYRGVMGSILRNQLSKPAK